MPASILILSCYGGVRWEMGSEGWGEGWMDGAVGIGVCAGMGTWQRNEKRKYTHQFHYIHRDRTSQLILGGMYVSPHCVHYRKGGLERKS